MVHRDLALRNLLLHKEDNSRLLVKVSDFGLARYVWKSDRSSSTGAGEE